ncbi:MAG: hypothetical protein ACK5P5_07210 [Pseudobdellovibrionaceae bacterium]
MDDDSHTENQTTPHSVSALIKQLKSKKVQDDHKPEKLSFWEYITGDEEFKTSSLPALKPDQILSITKSLSDERKKINQKLERIHKELDLLSIKLDSLKLVGGDDEKTFERISELNNQGEQLSLQLEKLDANLKLVRDQREQLILSME